MLAGIGSTIISCGRYLPLSCVSTPVTTWVNSRDKSCCSIPRFLVPSVLSSSIHCYFVQVSLEERQLLRSDRTKLPVKSVMAGCAHQRDLRLLQAILQVQTTTTSRLLAPTRCLATSSYSKQRSAVERPLHRSFSVLKRPPPNYDGHVPLTTTERFGLAIGSAIASLINPRRAEMIAACGEATAQPFFIRRLRDRMLSDPTGRRILRDRPRITSKTMSLEKLRQLPENTVGRTYAAWLDREGVTPDTRDQVKYIDNEEEAYVMQRYRECHDFYHAVTGLPIFVEGEIGLKAFEFANTGLPMTGLSLGAIVRLKPAERKRMFETYLPWALSNGLKAKDVICVYWEEELETDVEDLRQRLGIERPPDLRETRKKLRDEKRAAKQAKEMRDTIGVA